MTASMPARAEGSATARGSMSTTRMGEESPGWGESARRSQSAGSKRSMLMASASRGGVTSATWIARRASTGRRKVLSEAMESRSIVAMRAEGPASARDAVGIEIVTLVSRSPGAHLAMASAPARSGAGFMPGAESLSFTSEVEACDVAGPVRRRCTRT
jgi:hypothetical protein